MLNFLSLENYKNLVLVNQKIDLQKLNILIGSNGSGKSNFISCLQFLNNCLTGTNYDNSSVSNFEESIRKIGNYKIININSDKKLEWVKFTYCFSLDLGYFPHKFFVLDIAFVGKREEKRIFIGPERLYMTDRPNYNDPNDLDSLVFLYDFRIDDPLKGEIFIYEHEYNKISGVFKEFNIPYNSLGLSILPKLIEDSDYSFHKIPALRIRNELITVIWKWKFYNSNNMDLYRIRTSEPKIGQGDIYLSFSGDNLALVLENLSKNIDFEDSLNIAMKSILPQTRRVRSARSGRLSLTVEWFFEGNKEPFYLDEMSDGTVRMLCWATILHSPHLPTLLVIDEPELGLHVAWMPILAEWIKQAAQKTQIIVTTHSPDLLDHFTDCLDNVLCFQRKDSQHFTINSLDKTSLQPKLEEGWQLGDLYRVGDPSVGGWPW